MALRVPKNKVKEGKYTSGGQFIEVNTNKIYKGYYCEFNNEFYIGKEFDIKSPKLTPVKNANTLLNKGKSLAIFSTITGITSQALQSTPIPGVPFSPGINNAPGGGNIPNIPAISKENIPPKFYCKKTNNQPIIIKEINETTYKSFLTNPLYQTTFTGTYQGKNQTIEDAEKQMPGLVSFLGL